MLRAPLLLALLLSGCGNGPASAQPKPDTIRPARPNPDRLAVFFRGYRSTRADSLPFPHCAVIDSAGAVLGRVLESDSAGTTTDGFVGPVPVRVYVDSTRILGIDLLDNDETPGYVDLIRSSDLFERLLEYRAGQRDTVDAVTLATITSTAIICSVTRTVDRFRAH